MKMLVLAAAYPVPDKPIALMYIHTRNLYYQSKGFEVTVLNFSVSKSYEWDGLEVLSLNDYKKGNEEYDLLLVHAPNIRNHYIFLKKYAKRFSDIVFFFHGHEVLYINKVYSKPYSYVKSNKIKNCMQNIYDNIKLKLWHNYFPQIANKSSFIFVSNWMLNEFKKWVKLTEEDLQGNIAITYNGIGKTFEESKYSGACEKKYDFITVRGNLDGSKYGVDIVCKIAAAYPGYKFLLIGKGHYFEHNERPQNVDWKSEHCNHKQIIEYLNQSRCALMPTRTDAQGVMACEMATFGIPLITSDITVCHEVFEGFANVAYISNENPVDEFVHKYAECCRYQDIERNRKYYSEETMSKEVKLFQEILSKNV